MVFQSDKPTAGLSIALGVQEVRPVDLVTAYGTLANGGKKIGHTTILTRQGPGRQRCRPAVPAAGRRAGREPPGRVHRHGHPGRQHEPADQPVLGQVRADRPEERAPAGDAQDRHEQRRQGPQRLRLHRPADRGEPDEGRVRPRGRRLERQQRQHGRRAGLLDRRHDLRLAGLPPGGRRRLGRQRLRPARRPRPGEDRPVHRASSRSPAPRRSTSGSSPTTARQGHDPGRVPAARPSSNLPGVLREPLHELDEPPTSTG